MEVKTLAPTDDCIQRIITDTKERIESLGKSGSKRDMANVLGFIVLEYMVFGKFELEDIAASINEALRGTLKRGADSNGEYHHVGKLVLGNGVGD